MPISLPSAGCMKPQGSRTKSLKRRSIPEPGENQAEKAAADLTAEIDQARSALADEWEDHMTDHERLLAAVEKKQPLRHPSVLGCKKGSGNNKKAFPYRQSSQISAMNPHFPVD